LLSRLAITPNICNTNISRRDFDKIDIFLLFHRKLKKVSQIRNTKFVLERLKKRKIGIRDKAKNLKILWILERDCIAIPYAYPRNAK
jgi:hypothetical protein